MTTLDQSVIDFVAETIGVKRERLTPDSTLFGDLGVDGADGWELIERFGQKFQVDLSRFRADKHFGPEGLPIYAPFVWLWFLVSLPFRKKRSAEEEAGLKPIRVRDLILAAKDRRWTL
jgi:acyl carrier protein